MMMRTGTTMRRTRASMRSPLLLLLALLAMVVVLCAMVTVTMPAHAFDTAVKNAKGANAVGTRATATPAAPAPTATATPASSTPTPATVSADAAKASNAIATAPRLDKLVIEIEHALVENSWTPRQTLEILFSTGQQRGSMVYSNFSFTDTADRAALEALVNARDLYRLRFRVANLPVPSAWVTASVRACALVQSALVESHVFHLDIYGQLIAMSYSVATGTCASDSKRSVTSLKNTAIRARSKLSFGKTAERVLQIRMRPPPVLNADGTTSTQAPAEPQSFFAQYWMYIVPIGAFLLLNTLSASMEEGAEGAGGGASGGGGGGGGGGGARR